MGATPQMGADVGSTATIGKRLLALIPAVRPRQWIKNLACFAGLIFSGQLLNPTVFKWAVISVATFCLSSSAVYLLNDVIDLRSDACNPAKRTRPIAAGIVPVWLALLSAIVLTGIALGWAFMALPRICAYIIAAYVGMNLLYSLRLKQSVITDVIIIALGFVLRVLHGVFAVRVLPSAWIVLCMFFLALFMGFGKRRAELAYVATSTKQRPVLRKYSVGLLDLLLGTTATMTIMSYALYTVHGQRTASLVITVPVVVYGIYRYLLMVVLLEAGEAPEKDVIGDRLIMLAVVIWIVLCIAMLYINPRWFVIS